MNFALEKLKTVFPDRNLDELTISDMELFKQKLIEQGRKESTVYQYFVLIKSGLKENKNLIGWRLRRPKSMDKPILIQDLPTAEEIQKLIDNCWSARDKAIISTLHQSGFRISELLSMKIKDVKFVDDRAEISCRESKTFARTVDIFFTNYLRDWCRELQSMGYTEDDWLWIRLRRNRGTRLCSNSIRYMLKDLKKATKLNKRLTPHIFRKCFGTFIYRTVSPIDAQRLIGHRTLKMMPIYCAGSNDKAREELRRAMGIEGQQEVKALIRPKNCPFCFHEVAESSDFCDNCRREINPVKLMEQKTSLIEQVKDSVLKELIPQIQMANPTLVNYKLQTTPFDKGLSFGVTGVLKESS
jgi:integrase